MLMFHYVARDHSIKAIGPAETQLVISGGVDHIREQFRKHEHGG